MLLKVGNIFQDFITHNLSFQEPVVIIDEDDENTSNEKAVDVTSSQTVETIDLDDETPIITRVDTVNNNTTKFNKKSEVSFRINLKNNRLMDKIVTRCINMENSTGMPRVVYKTLLPLYRDTNNRFKESKEFQALLKKTHKLLMRDPDHKFLHIKTLCEELKSGGLRRKVPFVTLATNLKNNYCLHGKNEGLFLFPYNLATFKAKLYGYLHKARLRHLSYHQRGSE